jgi:hypothetical protein
MKQFIKINVLKINGLNEVYVRSTVVLNVQMIVSINESQRYSGRFFITLIDNDAGEGYIVDQYTYDSIAKLLHFEIADLTPPNGYVPNTADEEAGKFFGVLTQTNIVRNGFIEVLDGGVDWQDHENDLFRVINKYTAEYAHGVNLALINYHKIIESLVRHWGLERND